MSRTWNGLPIVIFGIGGLAREIKTMIEDINNASYCKIFDIVGYVSHTYETIGQVYEGVPVVACNDNFIEYSTKFNLLGVTIALGDPKSKRVIDQNILSKCENLVYPNLIHPKANLSSSKYNSFGEGTIICAGVTLTTGIQFGKFVLININTTIGHDAVFEDYTSVNPLSSISGNVTVGDTTLIGAGASIREKTTIGKRSIVGLGAIVVKNVEDDAVMICKAASKLEK